MQRAMQSAMQRAARAVQRSPQARNMSGVPGKEQMNAAAARAGDEMASVGASLGENVQKLQWWTSAKVWLAPRQSCVRPGMHRGRYCAVRGAHERLLEPARRELMR